MSAPERIGPYVIVETIARGGMGVVYRGRRDGSGEEHALKTVAVPLQRMLAGIRREIHALARLRHPGIVRIVDEGVEGLHPWYAMELLEGRTLAEELARPAIPPAATAAGSTGGSVPAHDDPTLEIRAPRDAAPPRESDRSDAAPARLASVLGIFRKLCDALSYLHGEGIVHRDLKPANVLVVQGDAPVLVDFGLSTRFASPEGRESLDAAIGMVGTLSYMAPEQIRGEIVDARADLYAIGCMLYEAITGAPPFVADVGPAILAGHLEEEPVPPGRRAPGTPPALDALVLQLLAKDPVERLGHAEDVAAALETLGAPPTGAPAGRPCLYRPRLRGRGKLLDTLDDRLDALGRRRGAVVMLPGESGAGKTRVLAELAARAERRKIGVIAAAGREGMAAVLTAIGGRCRDRGPGEVARVLGPRAAVLVQHAPALAPLVPPGSAVAPLPAEAARERLVASLVEVVLAFAAAGPTMIAIDDLHESDDPTVELLSRLARHDALAASPITVVAAFREEEASEHLKDLAGSRGVETFRVGSLGTADVTAMIADMLALAAPPADLCAFVAAQAQGNPFFASEYLRVAVDARVVTRSAGRWSVTGRSDSLPTPRTILDLVETRISAVSPGTQRVVEALAVGGREIDAEVASRLVAALGLSEAAAMEALEEARARGILHEPSAGTIAFLHDKLREGAVARIGRETLPRLHRAAAEALVEIHGDGAPQDALGRHWEAAGAIDRARDCYQRAARSARERFSLPEAASLLTAYLSLCAGVDLDAMASLADIQRILGRTAETSATCARLLSLARERGDRRHAALALRTQGIVAELAGRVAEARASFDAAIAIQIAIDDGPGHALSVASLANLLRETGRLDDARELLEHAVTLQRSRGRRLEEGVVLGDLGNVLHDIGRLPEARAALEKALVADRETGNRRYEAIALGNLALVSEDEGRRDDAMGLFEQALEIHRQMGDRRLEAIVAGNLGGLLLDLGDAAGARPHLLRALEIRHVIGDRRGEGVVRGNLGVLAQSEGQHPEARAQFDEALRIAREVHNRAFEAINLGNLAWLACIEGDGDGAEADARRALAIQIEIRSRAGIADAQLRLARVLRLRGGDLPEARRLASAALAFWQEQGDVRHEATGLVELGHLALAQGQPGRDSLERALALNAAQEIDLRHLDRAVRRFEAGLELVAGVAPEDAPPAWRTPRPPPDEARPGGARGG